MGFTDDNDNLPDWLSDLNPEQPGEAARPEDAPPGDDSPDRPAEQPAPEGLFGALDDDEDEVPDWLATIRTAEGRDPDEPPAVPAPPPVSPVEEVEDGTADWLAPIRARESGSLPPLEEQPEEDFSAKLQALKAEDNPPEDSESSSDWLAGLSQPEAEPVAGSLEPAPDSPDWLQEVGSGIGLGFSGESEPQAPAWLADSEESDVEPPTAPDWAAELSDTAAQAVAEEFPGLADEPGLAGDAPAWLSDLEPASSDSAFSSGDYQEAAAEVFKLDSGELPDWLAQISPEDALPAPPEESIPAAGPAVASAPENLAPAELPSWLQAMRPVAAIDAADLQDEDAAEAERIGPLAGLAGVLPAEPEIVQFGRPPSAAVGLQLSEAQRGFARQLAEMVAEEARPAPPTRRVVALPQRLVQVALALVLLAAVALPLIALLEFTRLPLNPPAEIQAVLDVVTGLPPGATVLVAVEYQPGFSGEVEAAAMSVVDHMIIRGVRLALLSTLPSGAGQIEHFMATTQSINHPDYLPNRDYYNLGYLPGGLSGLLQLATDPRQALSIHLPDGSDLWSQPAFANIFRVRDFAAVILLVDDPDVARMWVEQVQPALVDPLTGNITPLLVVASAQAEPLLYPYTRNEPAQIQGLVAGLRGGAYYEANIRPQRVRRYWDAYSAGLTVIVATLVIGAGLGVTGGLGRRKGGAA